MDSVTFMIEVTATRKSGPKADMACFEDEIRDLLDGQEIFAQDPDKEEETEAELTVASIAVKA